MSSSKEQLTFEVPFSREDGIYFHRGVLSGRIGNEDVALSQSVSGHALFLSIGGRQRYSLSLEALTYAWRESVLRVEGPRDQR